METRGFCLLSGGLRLSASRLHQMGITGVCVRGRSALQNQQPATSLVPSVALCRLKGSGHSASTELKKEGGLWVTVLPPSFPCDMWTRVEETPQPSKGSLSEAWKTSGPPWSRRRHSYPPHVGGGAGNSCYNKRAPPLSRGLQPVGRPGLQIRIVLVLNPALPSEACTSG